ncbi:MAG TPA: hypothetical protein VJ343_03215 [archaeon]|nr:hypothetical protein [archaeon]
MKNLDNELECPLYLMSVRSDATMQKYCSLCGMNSNNEITVKRRDRKFNFCSWECKNKFLKVGFRSFHLFKNYNLRQKHGML